MTILSKPWTALVAVERLRPAEEESLGEYCLRLGHDPELLDAERLARVFEWWDLATDRWPMRHPSR